MIDDGKFFPPKEGGFTQFDISTIPDRGIPSAQYQQWEKKYPLSLVEKNAILTVMLKKINSKQYDPLTVNFSIGGMINVFVIRTGLSCYLSEWIEVILVQSVSQNGRNLARDMYRYLQTYCPRASVILFDDTPSEHPVVCRPASPPPPKPTTPPPQPATTTLSDDVAIPKPEPIEFAGCAVCMERNNDAIVLPCSHITCFECASQSPRCPRCPGPKMSVIRGYL